MSKYHIRYVHKIAPRDTDTDTVELRDGAFADCKALAKALRVAGKLASGARIREMRVEGDRVVIFPTVPGLTTYWHSLILTLDE